MAFQAGTQITLALRAANIALTPVGKGSRRFSLIHLKRNTGKHISEAGRRYQSIIGVPVLHDGNHCELF